MLKGRNGRFWSLALEGDHVFAMLLWDEGVSGVVERCKASKLVSRKSSDAGTGATRSISSSLFCVLYSSDTTDLKPRLLLVCCKHMNFSSTQPQQTVEYAMQLANQTTQTQMTRK